MRWVYIFAYIYFFVLLVFVTIGLGKAISLFTGFEEWNYLKDFIEVASWVATIAGVLWAGNTYYQSEREKRYTRATDSLNLIMDLLKDLSEISKRRDRLVVLLSKLENQLKFLSKMERSEIEKEFSAFSRGVLKSITRENIFGPVSYPACDNISFGDWYCLDDKQKFDGNLSKTAMHLILSGYTVIADGKLIANDKENIGYLLTKLIKAAQPITSNNCYPNSCNWKKEDLPRLYVGIEKVPASIIYLLYSDSSPDILKDFKAIC